MKKILPIMLYMTLCLGLALISPTMGSANEYVNEDSECLICHTIELPGMGSEGEQHYYHQSITCDNCHQGTPQAGNVPASTCTVCHKTTCNSVNDHETSAGADCLSCHTECADGNGGDEQCATEELYGSDSAEAQALRNFRDNVLSKNAVGQNIISAYYKVSPAIVAAMEKNEALRAITKMSINTILRLIK
jgi:hypothetical protein